MKKRALALIIVGVTVLSSFTGCKVVEKKEPHVYNKELAMANIAKIESATSITIEENGSFSGKDYDILINSKDTEGVDQTTKIATVTGEYWKKYGDVFTLKDTNGNVLAYEKEMKRWGKLNRGAVIYNKQDVVTGYIGEETITKLFSFGHYFYFYDKDQKKIGISDEDNFSFKDSLRMFDNDKNIAFKSTKDLLSYRDTFRLSIENNEKIPTINAIFMVCIIDAISDSEKSEKKKKVENESNISNTNKKSSSIKSTTTKKTTKKKPTTTTTTTKSSLNLKKKK